MAISPFRNGWSIPLHPNPILAAENLSQTIEKRFWKYVRKTDGCWIWTGTTIGNNYGSIGKGSKEYGKIYAHRVSWLIHFGAIPIGLEVLHRCDVPCCVRPNHLWLGTHGDNMKDMEAKGRNHGESRPGEKNPRAVMTWEKVRELRRLREIGWPYQDLAVKFEIGKTTVQHIVRGNTWIESLPNMSSHIPGQRTA